MEKLLITGASGLLGSNLLLHFKSSYTVLGTCHSQPITIDDIPLRPADLRNPSELDSLFEGFRPDAVIHCAALTNVDQCETNPDVAYALNRDVAVDVARRCRQIGAKLIHISTDALYNSSTGYHTEDESPNPQNHYARAKLEAEEGVAAELADALIVRTNIYGWNAQDKLSLAEWILFSLAFQREFALFHDVIYSPIEVTYLGDILRQLLQKKAAGVFNVGSRNALSKYDFGTTLASMFDFNAKIPAISVAAKGLAAFRPSNLSMDCTKAAALLGHSLPSPEEGLVRFRELFSNGHLQRLKNTDATGLKEVCWKARRNRPPESNIPSYREVS